ncbi:Os01g0766966, partial [Oryza sativa Japonica Group]
MGNSSAPASTSSDPLPPPPPPLALGTGLIPLSLIHKQPRQRMRRSALWIKKRTTQALARNWSPGARYSRRTRSQDAYAAAKRPSTASRSGTTACQPWACAATSTARRSTDRRRKARRKPWNLARSAGLSPGGAAAASSESVRPAATRLRAAAATDSAADAAPVSFPAARCALSSSTHVICRAFFPLPAFPPAAGDPGAAAPASTSDIAHSGLSIFTTTGVPLPPLPSPPHHLAIAA